MNQTDRAPTRQQLYDAVWADAMYRVAQRYGVSGVALAKICRRHNIPVPERGYWAKRAAGHAPAQPPLPQPIADAFIITCQAQGLMPKSRAVDADCSVQLQGELITFAIFKSVKRKQRTETAAERRRREQAPHVWAGVRQYEYHPTGRLTLLFDGFGDGVQMRWSDGKPQRLEDLLPDSPAAAWVHWADGVARALDPICDAGLRTPVAEAFERVCGGPEETGGPYAPWAPRR